MKRSKEKQGGARRKTHPLELKLQEAHPMRRPTTAATTPTFIVPASIRSIRQSGFTAQIGAPSRTEGSARGHWCRSRPMEPALAV